MTTTLNKPAGLTVFPLHADRGSDCLVARLTAAEPWRAAVDWPSGFEAGVAHRLDTSTSGAVLAADDLDELVRLRKAFALGHLRKTYRFRSSGVVPWNEHGIDRPIAHARSHKGRMVVQRGPDTPHRGRWYPARTRLRRLDGELWEAVIDTGVMHQIRVHAAFVGLPLSGDRTYGGGSTPLDAPPGASFLLHHVGTEGDGFTTDPVELPAWARAAADPR